MHLMLCVVVVCYMLLATTLPCFCRLRVSNVCVKCAVALLLFVFGHDVISHLICMNGCVLACSVPSHAIASLFQILQIH